MAVGPLELPEPASPQAGQVLLEARACGVGNWDEIVRTGGWDTGARPPMALGVEAAGLVAAAGAGVSHLRPGDAVTTHAIPAGTWAERFTAAADQVSAVPAGVPMAAAAAFPVPALTADQALAAVTVQPGETVLVHGAGAPSRLDRGRQLRRACRAAPGPAPWPPPRAGRRATSRR